MLEIINESADFIRNKIQIKAKIAIVLGSGLNAIAQEICVEAAIPYTEIPNFPISTVEGHQGKFLIGTLNGVHIIAMQGRFHFYEGYDMKQVTFPIRVMKALGIEVLVLSNAAGGLNPLYEIGDVVLINDHINLFPQHPLRGKNDNRLGVRFPAMNEVYDKKIIEKIETIAVEYGIVLKKGVYVGVQGPTYETPSEYRMYYRLGGDCVGMSTVPEAIVARHSGMKCVCFSVITDIWKEHEITDVSHEEVLIEAQKAEPVLSQLLKELVLII